MKQRKSKFIKIVGWVLFMLAIVFFCLQMGYFLLHEKFQVEYVDHRLFYIINMLCVVFLALAVLFLFRISIIWNLLIAASAIAWIAVNGWLLVLNNKEIKNITSLSPDYKHVFSVKENPKTGEAVFYKSYFDILARPKEKLPYKIKGNFKVKWLAGDIAAMTYQARGHSIHQFIGTYGDRSNGTEYYYVGPEIQGQWHGKNAEVVNNTKGITVIHNGKTEKFDWKHVVQFGTLAVVLTKQNEAVWTISLNKNFVVHASSSAPMTGQISLYQATMKDNKPIVLHYQSLSL